MAKDLFAVCRGSWHTAKDLFAVCPGSWRTANTLAQHLAVCFVAPTPHTHTHRPSRRARATHPAVPPLRHLAQPPRRCAAARTPLPRAAPLRRPTLAAVRPGHVAGRPPPAAAPPPPPRQAAAMATTRAGAKQRSWAGPAPTDMWGPAVSPWFRVYGFNYFV